MLIKVLNVGNLNYAIVLDIDSNHRKTVHHEADPIVGVLCDTQLLHLCLNPFHAGGS